MKEIKKYTDVIRYGKASTQDVIKEGDYITITEKLDGCFHYDTMITLGDGSKEKIGKIVANRMEVEVMTYNFETKTLEPKKIINWYNHGKKKEFMAFKYQSPIRKGGRLNKMICTKDHLFYTANGWREAQYLTNEDTIYTFSEKINNVQEQLILGTLLGDSSIYPRVKEKTLSRNRGIAFTHSYKQIDYLEFKNKILDSYYSKTRDLISGYGSSEKQSTSICCREIELMIEKCVDENENKKINKNWLLMINPIGLAFWYMDDGSLTKGSNGQRERACFHTEGFSECEIDLLINMLKVKFNISSSKIFYKNKYFRIDVDTCGSEILFDIISPYIIKSMHYKLPKSKQMNINFWDYYENDYTTNSLHPIKISEISQVPNYIDNLCNYDIEVEDNHNYFAGGILVHNSNSSFCLDQENPVGVSCYSRNQILTEENRLRGFYDWVLNNITPIKEKLNTNYRYIGEWLVSHKVSYQEGAYYNFYLFSIWNEETEQYVHDSIVQLEAKRLGLKTPEYFYEGEYISFEHLMSFVGKSNLTLEHDTGEGIVVKNVNYIDRFGKQMFVKLVSEKFAEVQKQKLPKNPNKDNSFILTIKSVLTKARVEKLLYKLLDEQLISEDYSIEDMGILLKLLGNRIYEDIHKEEFEIIKDIEDNLVRRTIGKNLPVILKDILREQERL